MLNVVLAIRCPRKKWQWRGFDLLKACVKLHLLNTFGPVVALWRGGAIFDRTLGKRGYAALADS